MAKRLPRPVKRTAGRTIVAETPVYIRSARSMLDAADRDYLRRKLGRKLAEVRNLDRARERAGGGCERAARRCRQALSDQGGVERSAEHPGPGAARFRAGCDGPRPRRHGACSPSGRAASPDAAAEAAQATGRLPRSRMTHRGAPPGHHRADPVRHEQDVDRREHRHVPRHAAAPAPPPAGALAMLAEDDQRRLVHFDEIEDAIDRIPALDAAPYARVAVRRGDQRIQLAPAAVLFVVAVGQTDSVATPYASSRAANGTS